VHIRAGCARRVTSTECTQHNAASEDAPPPLWWGTEEGMQRPAGFIPSRFKIAFIKTSHHMAATGHLRCEVLSRDRGILMTVKF
jgi:hypothetical protein